VADLASARARALAALYGAGSGLGALTLLLAEWYTLDRPRLWAVVALAAGVAIALRLRDRVGVVAAQALVVTGTLAVAIGAWLAGGGAATATVAILHTFVAVYACAMMRPRVAALHIGLMAVAQYTVLVRLGETAQAPGQVVLAVGAAASTGAVVGMLVGQVRRLAASDPLTGLANRRAADAALERARADAQRSGNPLCVAVLDLDAFKQLNDTRGHATGDEVLRGAARNWSAELRGGDLLARMGGDEFMAVLRDCDVEAARMIATRLVDVTPPLVRCSVGVADWDGTESMERLLARADSALYQMKREGSGGVRVSRAPGPGGPVCGDPAPVQPDPAR
jgi:diguanylate cyclase (GGDEF)-like protein